MDTIISIAASCYVFFLALAVAGFTWRLIRGDLAGVQILYGVIECAGAVAFFLWGGVAVSSIQQAFIFAVAALVCQICAGTVVWFVQSKLKQTADQAAAEQRTAQAWLDYAKAQIRPFGAESIDALIAERLDAFIAAETQRAAQAGQGAQL